MTALTEFERLEAMGLWRPERDAQRRDVLVTLGDATLAIYTPDERALAHWSLPAIERLNPGERPALFSPGAEAGETLEIDDDLMIDAIGKVHRAVRRTRPRRGFVRNAVMVAALVGLGLLGVFWLPGALIRQATTVAPPAVRADTGARLLDQVARLTGPPCRNPNAGQALDALNRRLIGSARGQIVVVREDIDTALALPGGIVVLGYSAIEDHDGPGPAAAQVLVALERAEMLDPIARLLQASGPWSAIRLMTTGEVSDEDLRAYADRLVANPPPRVPAPRVIERFAAAALGAEAYTSARGVAGATALPAPRTTERAILSDGQWVALQSICSPS